MLSVDVIINTPKGIALIKRRNEPFKGEWCLPGGHVDPNETVERAAVREMAEELSARIGERDLRLVGIYSNPNRDPRYRNVAICFSTEYQFTTLRAGDDAAEFNFFPENALPERIGFDHARMIDDYRSRRG